ncbi:imidazole glycerol phosphate synthase subunit HisH [Vibrio sp. SCSIO 43136]|uniref:imidazole glycerol phosphate synthase subunit HisH n=1 Tax=Vibrio sp. SCSIO 43136 TaxID=2819101 RepID=UPI002075A848|nr:imidazole glycerol phosphate synthase subunit HisH [Vibrio sp. SCSIO 43136]USD65114.1 imidazole glycerol phosphate synthase subunit HisH [Vibrio sp. SCSIO 43136]
MNKFVILNLPGANVSAVEYWLKRSSVDYVISSEPRDITHDICLVLPGVGSFDTCISFLKENGLKDKVVDHFKNNGFMIGICLGMQICFESSEEGSLKGLSLIPGNVKKIPPGREKVPNIGWRELSDTGNFYFMHSYTVPDSEVFDDSIIEDAVYLDHNINLLASFRAKNGFFFQYHPEKSYEFGDRLLEEIINESENYR